MGIETLIDLGRQDWWFDIEPDDWMSNALHNCL
jgi:hypothetical protein